MPRLEARPAWSTLVEAGAILSRTIRTVIRTPIASYCGDRVDPWQKCGDWRADALGELARLTPTGDPRPVPRFGPVPGLQTSVARTTRAAYALDTNFFREDIPMRLVYGSA
ncbi:MAG: hypothetical protein ABI603_14320, partial [Acidobacteriota bacterium]